MRLRALLLAIVMGMLAAAPAPAQIRIVGRVVDDLTETPMGGAVVSVLAPDGSVVDRAETSNTGTFEFQVRGLRAVRIRVRSFGYITNTSPLLFFDARKFFQVEMRLDPDAILLAPLEVIAWSLRPENALHESFRRRLTSGLGVYITAEQIEARNPVLVSDMLREVPGVQLSASGYGSRPTVQMVRAAGKRCTTQIFVDGFLINKRVGAGLNAPVSDMVIDDVVSPGVVEGIEIYHGLSTVPPEFLNPDADCGVIAIWTRRGG